MAQQLPLNDRRPAWRLDEKTRDRGRRGIAAAREALAAHRPVEPDRVRRLPSSTGSGSEAA